MSTIQQLIDTVKESSELTAEKLSDTITTQELVFDMLGEIKDVLVETRDGLFEYFNLEKQRNDQELLAEIERRREAASLLAGGAQGVGELETSPEMGEMSFGGKVGFASLATALTSAVSGYVFGLIKTLGDGFKSLGTRIAKALKLDTVFTGIQTALQDAVKSFKPSAFVTQASVILEGLGTMITDGFISLGQKITNFFKPLTDIPKLFSLSGEGGFVSKAIEKITNLVKSIGGYFSKIFAGISKLAVPITALIGLFNAGQKTLEDVEGKTTGFWENVGIILENLITELVSAFVTLPAELLKKLVSWIAGKLGFENVEATLDSFDIDQMFREGIGGIFDVFAELFTRASDALYSIRKNLPGFLGGIGDEDIDLEAEQRIAQRDVTSAAQDIAAIDINQQNQDNPEYVAAMERYNEAVAKRDEVNEQLQQQTADNSQTTAEGMEALADAGTNPGSIYTHDEHVVEKLDQINETLGGENNTSVSQVLGGENNTSVSSNISERLKQLRIKRESSALLETIPLIQPTENFVTNFEEVSARSSSSAIQNMTREMQKIDVNNMSFDVPVNSMLNAPIGKASQEISDARSSTPVLIANSKGGDTVNHTVNNNHTTVMPAGVPARSQAQGELRRQNNMQGTG